MPRPISQAAAVTNLAPVVSGAVGVWRSNITDPTHSVVVEKTAAAAAAAAAAGGGTSDHL
eukprot:COSAG02_NODE_28866_length_580_cov_2.189189_1_plen_59_part_10